ncbi:hypothetical protein ACYX8G_14590 [Microbacterium saperdae]
MTNRRFTPADAEAAQALLSLVARWDSLTAGEKGAERAKGADSEFRDVPATGGYEGFEGNA